jgi:hypothetical protein
MALTRLAWWLVLASVIAPAASASETQCDGTGLPHPVIFALHYPVPDDFATIGSVFANHLADVARAGRGGDLMICHPDGTLRNLTREAGFGTTGHQGANAIAVRDPHVHWSGSRALFAMVIGAPTQQYQQRTDYWQLYEVTGLGAGDTVTITRVEGQPAEYNVMFVSDRPRNGARHLYPQLDEYESTPTPTGVWKLDAATGRLSLMQHSPSGSFHPFVDRYGRVVFTRWDHLQRDQQGDGMTNPYGAFDFASEAADAARLPERVEVFPEPRLDAGNTVGLRFNHFMPWMMRADGTGEETLNHVGRHELHAYFARSFIDDPALADFNPVASGRPNANSVLNLVRTVEDPATPGRYMAVHAPEFGTHAAGQLVAFAAPPERAAREITIDYLSDASAAGFPDTPSPGFARYRDPLPLGDGELIAAHSDQHGYAGNAGTRPAPQPSYRFRLRRLIVGPDGSVSPGAPLTAGITRAVSFHDPDVLVNYDGPFWELSPVAVAPRPVPPVSVEPAPESPEQSALDDADARVDSLRSFLRAWRLGLVVVRNTTTRDALDRQQPYNLRVPGGVQTVANDGRVYDVTHLQFLQGDQVRGYGGHEDPSPGRRVLARWLNDAAAMRFRRPQAGAPDGSAAIAPDGSVAMFVPANRALSWQLTDAGGNPVVRERYWLSLQPGEIRACDGCHGATPTTQAGATPAANPPQALTELLTWFAQTHDPVFASGFGNDG